MGKKKNKVGRPKKKETTVICFRVEKDISEELKAETEAFVKVRRAQLAKSATKKKG